MTQTPSRDWQKDMDMCAAVKDAKWLTLESSATAVWQRGGLMSTIWEGTDAEALQGFKEALPYYLLEVQKLRQSFEIAHMAYEGLQEDCVSRGEYESILNKLTAMTKAQKAEKARADAADEEARYQKGVTEDYAKGYRLQELRAINSETREQMLKKAIEDEIKFLRIEQEHIASGRLKKLLNGLFPDVPSPTPAKMECDNSRTIGEWNEDLGDVLWWTFPVEEPPYCGSPMCTDWPGYHTHWTPLVIPAAPIIPQGGKRDE